MPFADFETTLERRKLLSRSAARVVEADVIIITLGLIEAWYDHVTGSYMNIVPVFHGAGLGDAIISEQPKRFSFRVMSYQENMDRLEQLFGLLKRNMPKSFRILVTTSPVPLMATFSNRDVVVANTFSKSMLRTCAEEWQQMHPEIIDYFPSYEMALNSPREKVWREDGVHVQQSFADEIVRYFLKSCFKEPSPLP